MLNLILMMKYLSFLVVSSKIDQKYRRESDVAFYVCVYTNINTYSLGYITHICWPSEIVRLN